MAKTSRAMRRAGNPTVTERLNAEQLSLKDAIARAEQAVADGKRRNVLDAFKSEMRYAGIGSRPDIFRRTDDIEADVRQAAEKQILPEIDTSTWEGNGEWQNRRAQNHNISYGHPMMIGMPDSKGFAEYDIPVTHTWIKGATSTNAGQGKKTKEEKILKVRVNVLKGQGFRESQGTSWGEKRPWER